ncbi:hypothetical protein ASG43_13635 [Aureimonas sp. Leaf454]|uniref:DUF3108 domain-containing protein n=1 Tax=Aureimonas sp. Leaf454 TaxID=1736381 RepID=UPI0006FA1FE2|nr:DUF3108 domain-containing protein [Aureimonas sp. Leaf454]KQT44392.1 hypothetical protein ASG43_13635 [Aureimonas sp. Leaf454]
MSHLTSTLGGLVLATTLALSPFSAGDAKAQAMTSQYSVSLIGLPVGRASFDTTIDGNRFAVKGTLSSTGLADIVSKTAGSSTVSGRIRGDKIHAERYALAYSSDKRSYSSNVAFESGRVRTSDVAPKITKPKADYVPVKPAQLRSVVDPLSGLMIKADGTPDSVCSRTLPFFDGWSRLDLQLSPNGTRPFRTEGFEGDAIACNVRVKPVSGYRATSKGVKFIQSQTIELWFAPIGSTGIFAPVYAKIPTEIGPLTLRASVFAKS